MKTIGAPLQIVCDSVQELYCEVLRAICDGEYTSSVQEALSIGSGWGTRDRPTKELRYVTLVLENPRDRLVNSPICPLDKLIPRTLLSTLSDESSIDALAFYDPRATEFSDDGKMLETNYGYRARHLNQTDQIRGVIEQLRTDPNSRRAVIHIHTIGDHEKRYAPCIDSLHFIIRNGVLECQSFWRSENALTLLPVNLFEFTMLQELIASELEIPPGRYVQTVTSLHYYLDDQAKLDWILDTVSSNPKPAEMDPMPFYSLTEVEALTSFERQYRNHPNSQSALRKLENLPEYWQEIGRIVAFAVAKNSQHLGVAESLISTSLWKNLIMWPNPKAS